MQILIRKTCHSAAYADTTRQYTIVTDESLESTVKYFVGEMKEASEVKNPFSPYYKVTYDKACCTPNWREIHLTVTEPNCD